MGGGPRRPPLSEHHRGTRESGLEALLHGGLDTTVQVAGPAIHGVQATTVIVVPMGMCVVAVA